MLDDSVFDRPLEVCFIYFITFSLLPGLKKILNQSPVLLAGFGEFISQIQSSD